MAGLCRRLDAGNFSVADDDWQQDDRENVVTAEEAQERRPKKQRISIEVKSWRGDKGWRVMASEMIDEVWCVEGEEMKPEGGGV